MPTGNAIYPCIIELEEGKISNHSFQSPSIPSLYKLGKKLK